MVLDDTLQLLRDLCGDHVERVTIERIVIGVFFSGVKLSDGSGGVAYTPMADLHDATCCPAMAAESPGPTPLRGMKAWDVLNGRENTALSNTVKLVVMNALSSRFLTEDRYRIVFDADALDLVDIPAAGKIGMVGAFIPFLKRLKGLPGVDLSVIERKKETLKSDEMRFYVPAVRASEVLPRCDTVIITGASIANGTIDELLGYTRAGARVIVTGPTASVLPDALFARNVSMVSGVQVTDIDKALDLLVEGAGAFHLFGVCMRKINVSRR